MNLYDYLNYREFLRDFYTEEKSLKPFFSYRYMGRKVGLDSSFLARLIQSKGHLSSDKIKKMVKFLEFNQNEALYFENMVLFSKAKSEIEAKVYFDKLMTSGRIKTKTLERKQYEYYNKWYYSAIRSYISVTDFNGNYKTLAQGLSPSISVKEAKKAVKILTSLELVKKGDTGIYTVTDTHITTGRNFNSLAARNLQKEMIKLAGESLDRHTKKQCHVTSMTIAMDKEALEDIRVLTSDFLDAVKARVQSVKKTDGVYQMNLQVFPMSEWVESK